MFQRRRRGREIMNIDKAIKILKYYTPVGAINAGFPEEPSEDVKAFNLAIEALEKQAFFENQISNVSDWFVNNRDSLLDTALNVSTKSFNQYNKNGKIDEVDLEFIVSDIVDEIQKGILNVLSTYMGDYDA